MSRPPVFAGWRAVVLHRPDEGTDRLARQLSLLGLTACVQWSALDLAATPADLILVDADQGWDGLFPWEAGRTPVPIVALLQSEAPGRIAWALDQGATAVIAKPIAASAVYPALVLAAAVHAERRSNAARIGQLEERVRLRPLVHAAVRTIEDARGLDEAEAYRALRRTAMRRRLTLEQVAAEILAGVAPLPEVG
ncbi:ANTAR domain-containing response regulator [Chthonobacter albigriseus]|uniref:ANTAR domain-containing response regulator n=1 Tax=Chthonobacter albigriseus TaxID=1683161 RepID=UPI0015EFAF73|nr:ANTAR domain-containing protein [Chthonobacter albigriseus]